MLAGEEKTTVRLSAIFKYIGVKLLLLSAWMLWAYYDPTWFPHGVTIATLCWTVGVMVGIDLLIMTVVFGLVGIRQEVRVKRRGR